ncbi:MAG: hypothetical protein QNL04_15180 [SAR324 cluster bacterium]|nr:hypothetical protein [SAR324 cluster bacterium]
MSEILDLINDGDAMVLTGRTEAAEMLLSQPDLIKELATALDSPHVGLKSRALEAMRIACESNPEIILPIKFALLDCFEAATSWQAVQNLCILLPFLGLTPEEMESQMPKLFGLLESKSRITIVSAMQCLTEFALAHRPFKAFVAPEIWKLTQSGAASAQARGKKLMKLLEAL